MTVATTGAITIQLGGAKGDKGDQGIQGIPGDIAGPSSAVDGQLAAFDGATGKLLKDIGYAITDLLRLATAGQTVSGELSVSGTNVNSGTTRLKIVNTAGDSYALIAGIPGIMESGFSIYDVSNSRFSLSVNDHNYVGLCGVSDGSVGLELPNSATIGEGLAYAWGTHSSRRWKTNIAPLQSALEKISLLQGVEFDWRPESGGKHDIGLIAEDVGKVIPEVVTYEKNGIDATGLRYDRLVAVLIEAMKEQQKQIDELKAALKI